MLQENKAVNGARTALSQDATVKTSSTWRQKIDYDVGRSNMDVHQVFAERSVIFASQGNCRSIKQGYCQTSFDYTHARTVNPH